MMKIKKCKYIWSWKSTSNSEAYTYKLPKVYINININSLGTFIELAENDIFKPANYKRIKNNISNQERKALKDIQKDTSKTFRIQDKGSRFVVLDSDSYIEKIDRQLERSSFQQLG